MKSVLCHLYSSVQPPLCGFKLKSSFMYLQKLSHRSIFFKEMLRFVLSDNAATLSDVTHEERGNFPKNIPNSSLCHPHVQSLVRDRAACGSHRAGAWGGITPQPLPGCPRQSRISLRPPFPPSTPRALWVFITKKKTNLATRFKIKGTELRTLQKIWRFAEVSK